MALGEFETEDLQHFMAEVRDGDIVFDIGANVGAYCVPIGLARPAARIHAFEPIGLNASLIEVSLHLNRLSNVRIVRKCVSDQAGRVAFSLAEDSAYSSMIDTGRKAELRKFECDALTLDDYCRENGNLWPDVLKMDVEGAELKVLAGARNLFEDVARRPRHLLIELDDRNLSAFGTSIGEVTSWLAQRGYRPYVLTNGAKVPFAAEHYNRLCNVFFASQ